MRLRSAVARAEAPVVNSRSPRMVAVAVSLFVAFSGLSAPVHAQDGGNAVTEWNQIAFNTLVPFPGPAGGAPPALQVHLGMVQGAVYDAVNATAPKPRRPYLLAERFAPTASKEAAAATAAYRVLSTIVSTVPERIPFPNRADLLQALDTQYETSLAAIPDGPSKADGIAAGNAAADAMIAAREDDGRFGPTPWKSNAEQGHWQPQLNPDGTQVLDPTPWVGGVRPFLIESASQFRTEGPLSLTSEAWVKDFNEVKALGSVNSTQRTPEQTHNALFWQSTGGPSLMWNAVARGLVNSYGVDIVDSALLFAQLNLSGADAAISCWSEKYYWDFWRPWNAVVEADRDGNPATEPDTSWTPLLYAPYPSHPSGHLSLDGAQLRVLQTFFGTDEVEFDVTSSRFEGETRHFERFSQPLDEIVEARIWAGLHYRNADVQARILGETIADYIAGNYFQPAE
jgi:hypothetical protein